MADGQHDAQPRTLKDYVRPIVNDNYSGIRHQTINANNFELKPTLTSMVQQAQFSGSPTDDPNIHLAMFLEIYDTIKINGVTEDTIRLRLFPFSLRDKARGWLQSLQSGSITSRQDMAEKFLAKFFPPAKTAQLMSEIGQFKQNDFESLYEAWERYKDLIRRCPQHGLPDWLEVQMFYNGLNGQTRTIVDVAFGRTLMSKTTEEYIAATSMTVPSNEASQEQVQYINNQNYNYRGFDSQPSEKKMSLEDAMVSFVQETNARFKRVDSRLDNIETHCSNMGATMKNLEVQIGQLATTINAQQRGAFPSNTEVNPKEQCKAITLRSGREIERSPSKESKSTPTAANNGQNKNKVEEEEIVNDTLRETDMPPAISLADNHPILSTPLPYPQHVMEQMPNYVKFLKDIISKKSRKLGLGEMKQTTISSQLEDRSIKYPRGIIEDVLVKVDKFIFLADFVVLDMEEDEEVPLILGRPFLATGRALIDVQKGELTLRVNKEEVASLSNEVGKLESMVAKIDSVNSKEKMQQTTTPELKQLPNHLRYAFLGDAYENAKIYKERTKKWHDKQILRSEFAPGQQAV
ncbi:uncharacterized protein [Aristolochia californica]|uniref:uncharacterized protein n=1 Tax=Aristolochia californica TaxID=171875 RepID=UPI0035E26E66